MELNLRKARKLESKIQTHVSQADLDLTVAVRVKGTTKEATDKIDATKKELVEKINTLNSLLDLRYTIRKRIDLANLNLGINGLLADKELMAKKREILAKAITVGYARQTNSTEELEDLLTSKAAILNKGENYHAQTTEQVAVLDDKDKTVLEDQSEDLVRRMDDIDDQLGQKNLGGKISLTEPEVALLKSAKIL